MKTFLIVIIVVAGALWYWKHGGEEKLDFLTKKATRGDVTKQAKERVGTVLGGMQKDGGGIGAELQTAICEWDRGVILIRDRDELERAVDAFNRWCQEKNFYNRKIGAWQVTDASCDALGDNCLVTAKIEGGTYKMKVPRGARISWTN